MICFEMTFKVFAIDNPEPSYFDFLKAFMKEKLAEKYDFVGYV